MGEHWTFFVVLDKLFVYFFPMHLFFKLLIPQLSEFGFVKTTFYLDKQLNR